MVSETVEATESCCGAVTGLVDQAFRAYGDTLKVALKAQEDTVKFWGEAVGKVQPLQTVAGDLLPLAQKNTDEYLKVLESSYRRNAELLKKAVHCQSGGDGVEKNGRELWEASVETARENAQELVNTNVRVAQAWNELLKKGVQQKAAVGK